MAEKQQVHERFDELREAFLYAPLGLLYEYDDIVPRLVRRGKSQVQIAKMIGMAAGNRSHLERNLSDAADGVSDLLARGLLEIGQLFGLAPDTATKAADPAQETDVPKKSPDTPQDAQEPAPKAKSKKSKKSKGKKRKKAKSSTKAEAKKSQTSSSSTQKKKKSVSFPIDNYDDMTAKNVLPLLTDLSGPQRKLVRKHEIKNRNRKTVLAKLDRLDK